MKMGWEMLFSHTSDIPSHFSRGRGEVNLVPGIANMAKVQWAHSNAKTMLAGVFFLCQSLL